MDLVEKNDTQHMRTIVNVRPIVYLSLRVVIKYIIFNIYRQQCNHHRRHFRSNFRSVVDNHVFERSICMQLESLQ